MTTLKTVSMYLRAAKTDAEEAGIETDGMANSVSELRNEILTLTKSKVDIMADDTNFKDTYEIIKELSEVWDDLEDVDQANILELVGGKRNSNVVAALIENFSIAEEALGTSADSAGSALEENEKYLDSVQGRIDLLSASFETLSSNFISSDMMKGVINTATTLLNIVNSMVEGIGALPTLIATIATGLSAVKNVGRDKMLSLVLNMPTVVYFCRIRQFGYYVR